MAIQLNARQMELVEQLLTNGRAGRTADEVIETALRVLVDEQAQDIDIPTWHYDEVRKGLEAADRGEFVNADAASIIAAADADER